MIVKIPFLVYIRSLMNQIISYEKDSSKVMNSGSIESQIQELLNESSLDSKNLAWSTICRTPKSINQEDDPKSYVPELVSIGPHHCTDTTLALMQKHKIRFFISLSKRLYGGSSDDIIKNDLINAADKMVDKVRECYSDSFNTINDSDFSWMIVLDACFILELFRLYYHRRQHSNHKSMGRYDYEDDDDPIFSTRWVVGMVRMDLLKMENQLPFFVLEQFYDLIRSTSSSSSAPAAVSLTKYAANFFAQLLPFTNNIIHADFRNKNSHVHLLAFLHKILNPESKKSSITADSTFISISDSDGDYVRTLDSVLNLTMYGVQVKKGNGRLLDIQFSERDRLHGLLEIPSLEIDKNTILLFRNLLAYEVSDTRVPSYIASYITFFCQLLNSPRDVSTLRKARILRHSLVSDEQLIIEIGNCLREVKSENGLQNCYLNMQVKKLDHFKNRKLRKFQYFIRKFYLIGPGTMLTYLIGLSGLYLGILQLFNDMISKK